MDTYTVEKMNKEEVAVAVSWAAKEGWEPGKHDADCFYAQDKSGFFKGVLNGKIIAVGSAIIYDENFAFCGLYIVDKTNRGCGYGFQLTKARLNYVGDRNCGIDGVVEMQEKYKNLGYKIAHNNYRYGIEVNTLLPIDKHCKPIGEVDYNLLLPFDRRHFPAKRDAFLKAWINQDDAVALAFIEQGKIRGYGLIRDCGNSCKIGPLFAESIDIADSLFCVLQNTALGKKVYLDIPGNNPYAKKLVDKYNMKVVFETARMYLKGEPKIEKNNIYGITSFELG